MKIEALEAIKSGGYVLDAGDVKTVADELGTRWCALGWARDVAGEVPTGERKVIDARLSVDNGVLTAKTANVGVKTDG